MIDQRLNDVPRWVYAGRIHPVDLLAIWEPGKRADLVDFSGNGWTDTAYLLLLLGDGVASGECYRGINVRGKTIWWQTAKQRETTRERWRKIDDEDTGPPTAVAPDDWEFPTLQYKPPLSDYERRSMT